MKHILAIILFISVSHLHSQGFEIKGHLKNTSNNSTILIKNKDIVLDSCKIVDNLFDLKGSLNQEPLEVSLVLKDRDSTYFSTLFIGNEKITLNGTLENFTNGLKTTGSTYDSYRQEYVQATSKLSNQKKKEVTLEFIEKNINSNYAIKLLNTHKKNMDRKTLIRLFGNIKSDFTNDYEYLMLKSYVNSFDLDKGDHFFDFKAFDIKNQELTFSDFFKDKYVLLNFSSLYCHWCEKSMPILEKVYANKKDKMDVFTFYVDEEPDGQEDFEKKQNNKWITTWDPNRKYNDYTKYKLNVTPTFYLFDKKGKLVEKIEGSRNLEKIINKYLK